MTTTGKPTVKAARPPMADVARHAGVSPRTVSRVSNGHSNVDIAGMTGQLNCRPVNRFP
jgi:hypothetical protein